MSVTASSHSPGTGIHRKSGGGLQQIVSSPILWGAAITWCFYALIPFAPVRRELIERYFCSHPLEYALAGLFWVGTAILVFRWLRLLPERSALSQIDLYNLEADEAGPEATAGRIERLISMQDDHVQHTQYAERLTDLSRHVTSRHSAAGVTDHLQYRADQAFDRLHESYDLLRTITWAVPILGFLGTVIGITLAIANLNPEQLASSLTEVTSGLAVAFDTTALSLALSLVLVFAKLMVERSEQRLLVQVEEEVSQQAGRLFAAIPDSSDSYSDANASVSGRLLSVTEDLITRQVDLWQESLDGMRQHWNDAFQQQSSQLNHALGEGMSSTLSEHDTRLASVSTQLTEAVGEAADTMHASVADLVQQTTNVQQAMLERIESLARQGQTSQRELVAQIGQLATEGQNNQKELVEQISHLTAEGQASQRELVDRVSQLSVDGQASMELALDRIGELTQQGQSGLDQMLEHQSERLAALSASVAERVAHWQNQLEETTRIQLETQDALVSQTQALHELTGGEHQLAASQKLLSENLEILRAADTIENAVQNLTGAVHLLTARVKPKAAA
ncbi:MAG: MotA/TolQ/ExbB proton channel family protein [Planctomycetaceae bacterium]|nr:MotA/TolQ/ExbB proton channel family protein [Planctomycetaceae bacterium]